MDNWVKNVMIKKEPVNSTYGVWKINDIIIPVKFLLHPPAPHKITLCNNFYKNHGYLDRQIVIDENNVLVDGYVGYIILRQQGADYCGVTIIE